ncbi:DUF2693 domain-containing protein [bacterium]|nr:DUF2693 domain-containing protein [bacterium]
MSDYSHITTLRNMLKSQVLSVTFLKKDGTERTMKCTLNPELLPLQEDLENAVQKKKPSEESIAVWDLEKEAWRSFRFDSIICFTGVN